MKKLIARVLLLGLVILSYGKSVFAGTEQFMNEGALGGAVANPITSIVTPFINWVFNVIFWPITVVILFFYGSYFYFRNKKKKALKEKAKKQLHLANWYLTTNLVIVILYIIVMVILKWLSSRYSDEIF